MRVIDGRIIADSEDFHLARNEMHVNEVGEYIVFRVLTDKGHLCAKAVLKSEPSEVIREVGMIVVAEAELDNAIAEGPLARYAVKA